MVIHSNCFTAGRNFHQSELTNILLVDLALDLEKTLNITVDIVDDRALTTPVIRNSMLRDAIPLELQDEQRLGPGP